MINIKNFPFIGNGASNHSFRNRIENDYYGTDPEAIDYLLKQEHFDSNIWECACGEGNLSKRLKDYGYNVYSTDLIDRGYGETGVDFLECFNNFDGDIITNPPYKNVTEFILKALELSKCKVAMFCKIQLLESQKRYNTLFKHYPPARVYVFVKRINCYRNNDFTMKGSAVCYSWFIWDKSYTGEPVIRWLY